MSIEQFEEVIQSELVNDEDVTYLISYVDEQGEKEYESQHPSR